MLGRAISGITTRSTPRIWLGCGLAALMAIVAVSVMRALPRRPLPPTAILSPALGSRVTDLRPMIEMRDVKGADVYLAEISPDPTFFDRNTLTYISDHVDVAKVPHGGGVQPFRYQGINQKYQRYADRQPQAWRWKVPHNLTALLSQPYGYQVLPCRDWLRLFTAKIVAEHSDPLQALAAYVSFSVLNEGSGSGYYDAYEMLSRKMGVCGNTAELVAAMAASQGLPSKILSLQAVDQGHVVAAVKRRNGNWALVDGLYNILVEGEVRDLINKVRTDPAFLDLPAFDGVAVPYRDFFRGSNYAYSLATTPAGLQFTSHYDRDKGVQFADLKWACGPEHRAGLEHLSQSVLSNVWFVRATYRVGNRWAPWTTSYFISDPPVPSGATRLDNATSIWRGGFDVPADFLHGTKIDLSNARFFSSATETGYAPANAFAPNGLAWPSRVSLSESDAPFVGVDVGTSVTVGALLVRWVTPAATPSHVVVEASDDGAHWSAAGRFSIDVAPPDRQFRVDYLKLPVPGRSRQWRVRAAPGDARPTAMAVEQIALLAPHAGVIPLPVKFADR